MYIYPLFNNLRLMYHFGPLSPAMGGDKSPPCGNLPLYTCGSLGNLIVALTPKYGRAGSLPPPTKVSFLQYGPISLL